MTGWTAVDHTWRELEAVSVDAPAPSIYEYTMEVSSGSPMNLKVRVASIPSGCSNCPRLFRSSTQQS